MLQLQREKPGLELTKFSPHFTYSLYYNIYIHMAQPFVAQEWRGQDCAGFGSCISWVTGLWGAAEAADHGKPGTDGLSRLGATGTAKQHSSWQWREQSWTFPVSAGKFTPSAPVQGVAGLCHTADKVFSPSAMHTSEEQSRGSTDHAGGQKLLLQCPGSAQGHPSREWAQTGAQGAPQAQL